jgi:hypothetical protein
MYVSDRKMMLPHKHMPKAHLRLRLFERGRLGDFVFRMELRACLGAQCQPEHMTKAGGGAGPQKGYEPKQHVNY